jgi:hypothetical protein
MITYNGINKIDIVYTYVNNTDKEWFNKISKYTNKINYGRFNFFGEIYFSLLSVQKFFNWVNKIYIVHDNQPFSLDFLEKSFKKKIIFVDHKEIIPHKYLPLFNSEVIECFIWKINELSDFFIYLNDDIFFGNYIYYSDFFTNNNELKIFYILKNNYYSKEILEKNRYLISYNYSELLFNNTYKTNYNIKFLHISFNLNKYICEYTFYIFYNYLEKNFLNKLRTYNNPNINIQNAKNFSFLHLCALMMIYKKISKVNTDISHMTIQQLTEDNYQKLLKNKPKIFNINQLYKEQKYLWDKLQKNYFNIFLNNYDIFFKKIKSETNKIKKIN